MLNEHLVQKKQAMEQPRDVFCVSALPGCDQVRGVRSRLARIADGREDESAAYMFLLDNFFHAAMSACGESLAVKHGAGEDLTEIQ